MIAPIHAGVKTQYIVAKCENRYSRYMEEITPKILLQAYASGYFPMADTAQSTALYWYDPELRGQLPIADFHVSRRLRKTVRRKRFDITFDRDFSGVIRGCAEPAKGRWQTWINAGIIELFEQLHEQGYAHSVEAWLDGELVGGVYGLALGGAFFAESMFSRRTDASKVALVHLVARLWKQGYTLLDTQFLNDHLLQFGAYEITRADYKDKLAEALEKDCQFSPEASSSKDTPTPASSTDSSGVSAEVNSSSEVEAFLQSITQTSKTG